MSKAPYDGITPADVYYPDPHMWIGHVSTARENAQNKGYRWFAWNGRLLSTTGPNLDAPTLAELGLEVVSYDGKKLQLAAREPAKKTQPARREPLDTAMWRENLKAMGGARGTQADYLATLVCTLGDRVNELEATQPTWRDYEPHAMLHQGLEDVVALADAVGWDIQRLQDEIHAYWENRHEGDDTETTS